MKQELDDRGSLRRDIGILGNVLVCLGLLCSLLGALLFVGEGNFRYDSWWWSWVVSLGAFAVGAVLIFGIAPVLVNWAKEGKFSWHS